MTKFTCPNCRRTFVVSSLCSDYVCNCSEGQTKDSAPRYEDVLVIGKYEDYENPATTEDIEIDGLRSWLKLDGNATDSSIYEQDGVWSGTEGYQEGKPFSQSAYFLGNSLTTNYIQVPLSRTLVNGVDFSVSCWVKILGNSRVGTSVNQHIVGYYLSGAPEWDLLYGGTSGKFLIQYRISSTTKQVYSNNIISFNTWYHITYVVNLSESKLYLYLNGIEEGNTSIPDTIENITNVDYFRIGKGSGSATNIARPLYGDVCDVRFYTKALNSKEVEKIYNSGNGLTNNVWQTVEKLNGNATNLQLGLDNKEQGKRYEEERVHDLTPRGNIKSTHRTRGKLTYIELENGKIKSSF